VVLAHPTQAKLPLQIFVVSLQSWAVRHWPLMHDPPWQRWSAP
jgi:hypothetical protein